MWHMKTIVILLVVDALGTVKKGMIENIKKLSESYYDKDSKDLHAGICANPQKGAQCMNRVIDLSD